MSDSEQAHRIRHLEAENARLRNLLDQQGVSSALRHQVRNTLGLMRAILRQSAVSKSTAEDLAAHVDGRFNALLRVQTALLSSPDGCIDLGMLVSDELMTQMIAEGDRASLAGPPVRIAARQAELLGLAVHELATNAIKVGPVTASGGHIDVSWSLSGSPQRLSLVWVESGRFLGDTVPPFHGFGMEAIQGMLPYQFKAESRLEWRPEGLHCTITLPLVSG